MKISIKSTLLALSLLTAGQVTLAAECKLSGLTDCKEARKNDKAEQYGLRGDELVRVVRIDSGKYIPCTITNNVESFKISQHPTDAAVLYYAKKEGVIKNLYVVHNQDDDGGQCPKASKKMIMENIKEYSVTSNTNTDIVNSALSMSGTFKAWGPKVVIYQDEGVTDFAMNSCYKTKGKSFSSYVLFTLDSNNQLEKVKLSNEGIGLKDASKKDTNRYGSIGQFIDSNNVCK